MVVQYEIELQPDEEEILDTETGEFRIVRRNGDENTPNLEDLVNSLAWKQSERFYSFKMDALCHRKVRGALIWGPSIPTGGQTCRQARLRTTRHSSKTTIT